MNQQNVDFLKDRLFFLGFGDKLNSELEKKIEGKAEKFTLPIQGEFGKDDQKKTIDYSLDFTKSKKEDMYFLNNYTATLKNEDPAKEKSHKFYLNNGSGVTAKEAYNMLEGRAVHKKNLENKDGQKYEAWLQLNFDQKDDKGNFKQQQYHQKWNYDLERNLSRHPIKELKDTNQKPDLIKSLQKGNLQQVTFLLENKEAKWFVEANPKDRNVNVFDENMRKQFQGIRQAKSEGKSESQSQVVDARGADSKDRSQSAPSAEIKSQNPETKETDGPKMNQINGQSEKSKAEKKGIEKEPVKAKLKKKGMSI